MSAHRPSWFQDGKVLIINAPTCGINKDGNEQYVIDRSSGARLENIDDQLWDSVEDLMTFEDGNEIEHTVYVSMDIIDSKRILVPSYYDYETIDNIKELVGTWPDLELKSLGDLVSEGRIMIRGGHGSPSADLRVGDVPYIKVSDLRAGHVNINPTNLIPRTLAKSFWRGDNSKLRPYDLISPERASKNIGEFCVLMPGQEDIVLTKEVMILRAAKDAPFDQFFLMWAMSLQQVRQQWGRIVFMQTNREDVGNRMLEVLIPVPKTREVAEKYSAPFKAYYTTMEAARNSLKNTLSQSSSKHQFFL